MQFQTRRYDIIVNRSGARTYYELKSYKNVPPDQFTVQFINDLSNPSISDLSNLKWVFDKTKYLTVAGNTEQNFKDYMEDAVKKLILSNLTYPIMGKATDVELMNELLSKFDSIFILK